MGLLLLMTKNVFGYAPSKEVGYRYAYRVVRDYSFKSTVHKEKTSINPFATTGAAPSFLDNPVLIKPTTSKQLLRHLAAILTRNGQRGEPIVANAHYRLQTRYRHPEPIKIAIDALKPVIRYQKSKNSKAYIPMALYPRTAEAMALRWVVRAANSRMYVGERPDIVRGLTDEFDAIIQGTSSLFRKRFDIHRNPN